MSDDPCARCAELTEQIEDYFGHRLDGVAGKIWGAQHLFSRFEGALEDLIGEFDRLGHDDYDQSLEIYGVPDDVRLGEEAQRLIRDAGFHRVYVNHHLGRGQGDNHWETHYTFGDKELPVRGWRRRYVQDATVSTTNVLAGPPNPGYYEVSYIPEGWTNAAAEIESGFLRVVPDPLDP